MIAFDDKIEQVCEMKPWNQTNQNDLKKKVLALAPRGGTNLELALNSAGDLLQSFLLKDKNTTNNNQSNSVRDLTQYDHRVIFLTDCIPTVGSINSNDIATIGMQLAEGHSPSSNNTKTQKNQNKKSNSNPIFVTYIGKPFPSHIPIFLFIIYSVPMFQGLELTLILL